MDKYESMRGMQRHLFQGKKKEEEEMQYSSSQSLIHTRDLFSNFLSTILIQRAGIDPLALPIEAGA